jgi:hypothetical protein
MKVSIASLFYFLTTWQALANVTDSPENTNAAVRRPSSRHQLRKLALHEPTAAPAASPGNDNDSDGDTLPPTFASSGDDDNIARGKAGSDEENVPTEGPEGDGQHFSVDVDTPTEAPGEEPSTTQEAEESPAESPTVDADESPAAGIDESPAAGIDESPVAGIDESPAAGIDGFPTTEGGDDDEKESPSLSPIDSRTEGGDDDKKESPSISPTSRTELGHHKEQQSPSPSPTNGRTRFPTTERPSYEDVPTLYTARPSYETPKYPTPTVNYPFSSPGYVPPSAKPYVSNNDEEDPIVGPSSGAVGGSGGSSSGSGSYAWENSTVDEMEHDRTVIIALSVVFGTMFLFSVIVAHQMLENPGGCCAR